MWHCERLGLLVMMAMVSAVSFGGTLYVDDSATGANNGTNWADAYLYLQDALSFAASGDTIFVAKGTYWPDQSAYLDGLIEGDRRASFTLKMGVTLLGGFAGVSAGDPGERNPSLHPTILSGDLDGNDPSEWDLNQMVYHPDRRDNSIHVVVGTGTDGTAVLEGFTITGGNANVPGEDGEWVSTEHGGGLYNAPGDCIVRDCVFVENSAAMGGGAVYNRDGSRPVFENCVFRRNAYVGMYNDTESNPTLDDCVFEDHLRSGVANYDRSSPILTNCQFLRNGSEYEFGGGICNGGGSSPVIQHCLFEDNFSGQRGGALYFADKSNAAVTDCVFRRNRGTWFGGAAFSELSSPVFQRCIFEDNVSNSGGAIGVGNWSWYEGANSEVKIENCLFKQNRAIQQGPVSGKGGAISANIWQQNRLLVTNCTFAGNTAWQGRALLFDSFMHNSASEVIVKNCILWDGGDEIVSLDKTVVAQYSNIEGGYNGQGNLNALPMFIDSEQGDFRLMSMSPCVDKGDNAVVAEGTTDLTGNLRIRGKTVDMGAYEFQGSAEADILCVPSNYATIQAAIDAAVDGQTVLVADGTYTGVGNRDIDFHGKAITVRSENGPQRCIIDCQGATAWDQFHRGFVFSSGEGLQSILEGFTITNGTASTGAGILCANESSPTIRGNIIQGNRVPNDWDGGGGIACRNGAAPLIVGNVIRDNVCEPGNSGGGGIHCSESGTVRIIGNTIVNNSASFGGGIDIVQGGAVIENNLIAGNTAGGAGGVAIWNLEGELTLRNNTIAFNTVKYGASGVLIQWAELTSMINCIVWGNASSGVSNEQIGVEEGYADIRYCCIQDWDGGGVGNIRANPLFAKVAMGDYHLKSQAGRWDAVAKAWVRDAVTSPSIDAGDPCGPIGPEPFPNGGVVNLGFDGGTAEASKSWFGGDCAAVYAGDINGDCAVNLADFAILARNWLQDGSSPR